jgi:carbon-monoxide dehydrogenase medium subunit
MKPRPFAYFAPEDVEAATTLLAEYGDDAMVLAGGQSLMPLLNFRLASPAVLVDISRLDELRTTHPIADGGRRMGSALTHSAIEDDRIDDPTGGLLPRVATGIAHRSIRNRGTLGGSLAHADPLAEWPLIMCALGADVQLRSLRGERTVAAADFVQGFFTTDRADDELCVSIDVPALAETHTYGFCKLARQVGDFAEAMAVAIIGWSGDDTIEDVTLWLGATRNRPVVLSRTEQVAVEGVASLLQRDLLAEAVRLDLADVDELGDAHRVQMHSVAVERALREATTERVA